MTDALSEYLMTEADQKVCVQLTKWSAEMAIGVTHGVNSTCPHELVPPFGSGLSLGDARIVVFDALTASAIKAYLPARRTFTAVMETGIYVTDFLRWARTKGWTFPPLVEALADSSLPPVKRPQAPDVGSRELYLADVTVEAIAKLKINEVKHLLGVLTARFYTDEKPDLKCPEFRSTPLAKVLAEAFGDEGDEKKWGRWLSEGRGTPGKPGPTRKT